MTLTDSQIENIPLNKFDDSLNQTSEWYKKNNSLHLKMKDECLFHTTELVKKYGIETEDKIIFVFDEENQPSVLEFCFKEIDYRIIKSIVYDKSDKSLTLLYGEEQWEYINYNDVILDDRMDLLDVIINYILDQCVPKLVLYHTMLIHNNVLSYRPRTFLLKT